MLEKAALQRRTPVVIWRLVRELGRRTMSNLKTLVYIVRETREEKACRSTSSILE